MSFRDVLSKFGIHFAFEASNIFKESPMNFLEADLNDIDEFIQAEIGFQTLGAEASLVGTGVNGPRCSLPFNEILNTSPGCKGRILIIIIIIIITKIIIIIIIIIIIF